MDDLKTSRIFLTGGSGMVGRNLTTQLEKLSLNYYAPTSKEVNLLDYGSLMEALSTYKPGFVIHCAGTVGGIAANINEPYRYCDENSQMGLNLIRAASVLGIVKLLNLGSSCMYPVQAPNPLQEKSILSGNLEPTNEGYALAKILVARLCEYASSQCGVQYKTIIPCNLYGKHDHFDSVRSHMIPAAILKIHNAVVREETTVDIWGDGLARREFMYAEDLAEFLLRAIGEFDHIPETMNVGLGCDYSINEYYQEIADVIGFSGRFVHDLSKPSGMRQKLVNIDSQRNLGWMPKTPLATGIRETYSFFLEQNA